MSLASGRDLDSIQPMREQERAAHQVVKSPRQRTGQYTTGLGLKAQGLRRLRL